MTFNDAIMVNVYACVIADRDSHEASAVPDNESENFTFN